MTRGSLLDLKGQSLFAPYRSWGRVTVRLNTANCSQISARDRSATLERSHHELSCPAISHWINRGSDLTLVNDSQRFLIARNIGEGQGRPSAILDGRFARFGLQMSF